MLQSRNAARGEASRNWKIVDEEGKGKARKRARGNEGNEIGKQGSRHGPKNKDEDRKASQDLGREPTEVKRCEVKRSMQETARSGGQGRGSQGWKGRERRGRKQKGTKKAGNKRNTKEGRHGR